MGQIDLKEVRVRLDAVVAAMKKCGAWDVAAPPAEAFDAMGAFGMNTMAFEQWLRFVFVPNVEALIVSDGPWPTESAVAAHAAREGDGNPPIAALVPALHGFDALFEPDAPPSAAAAYERSRDAFRRSDHAAALEAIRETLAIDRAFPNALNFAGWVLSHLPARSRLQLEEAIGYFREAGNLAPDDFVPLANLCDSLIAAGREAEAVAEAESASEGPHWNRAAGAHNWLGWRLLEFPDGANRAVEHFEKALQRRQWWGVARANLARALERAGRGDEAYQENGRALACEGDIDRAFCHERRGAYEAQHGWLRNALRSFRMAAREERKRGGARERTYAEAIEWLERTLQARDIAWPPPSEDATDEKWLRACELELPPGFGLRNERGEPLADDVVEVERLVRAERWADALGQLETLHRTGGGKLFDAVGLAERGAELARRAGHRAEAIAMMRLVVDGYRWYLPDAGAAAEGIYRQHVIDEKLEKLRAWEREP
jgi:uncharacterized protein YqcC (DUF446 family)/Tfp pilus assembly protein PilF